MPASAVHARDAEGFASTCAPFVRLFAERVLVTRTEGLVCRCEEVLAPLMALRFDGEPNPRAEASARAALERLGAVELCDVDDIAAPIGCDADYIVRFDADRHAFCDFSARAIPRLRAMGFRIEIDADYPFQVTAPEAPWYATIEPTADQPDWFSLELGVEVDGKRIDLLPLVVDLLEAVDESEGLRGLEGRTRASYALKISGTHSVTMASDRLRALVQVIIELYQGVRRKKGATKVVFPGAKSALIAKLDDEITRDGTRLQLRDPAEVMKRGRAIAAAPAPIHEPQQLRASLRPYQKEGVAFLQHLRACGVGGILADDMGLGKTLQTIAHLCVEKAAKRLETPALVVAPTSLVGNWQRELAKFAPHMRVAVLHGPQRHSKWRDLDIADVVITTYPLLIRDEERFAKLKFHMLVLDEAQAIKNTRSLAHQAIVNVQADHHVCLTGTPVENHLGELWALFEFLNPGLLGDEMTFRRTYRQPIEQGGDEDRLEALRELTSPYVLRRMKTDVAKELPPKTEMQHSVELSGKQRELYEQIRVAAHADVRKAIRTKGLAASALPILDALMKLRQVCCDPRLLAMDSAREVRGSAKLESLMELMEQLLANKHRVLIFSQFTSMLALIGEGLRARGTDYVILTGETRERQRVVDAFERGDADVFLISLKAGGTGLNLTSADTVIHYDPWWNPAAQAQATDRAYRIGQQRPVHVYNLFVAGSVEERVMALQQKKRWLSSSLLGDGGVGAMGADEVDGLFAPLEESPSE